MLCTKEVRQAPKSLTPNTFTFTAMTCTHSVSCRVSCIAFCSTSQVDKSACGTEPYVAISHKSTPKDLSVDEAHTKCICTKMHMLYARTQHTCNKEAGQSAECVTTNPHIIHTYLWQIHRNPSLSNCECQSSAPHSITMLELRTWMCQILTQKEAADQAVLQVAIHKLSESYHLIS